MNISYDDFKTQVKSNILDYMPDEYKNANVSIQVIRKTNDVILDGLMIRNENQRITPTIYLNPEYEAFLKGKSIESILTGISSVYVRSMDEKAGIEELDVASITSYEAIKDKLLPRLISPEFNTELLNSRPHTDMDGLAVTYCIVLSNDEMGMMSVPITNEIFGNYNVTLDQLHKDAVANIPTLSAPKIAPMKEILMEKVIDDFVMQFGSREAAEEFLDNTMGDMPMYVFTNISGQNGASNILCDEIMDSVYEKLGECHVIPSSVHELILIPKKEKFTVEELNEMIRSVNETEVSPQERLSNFLFAYDFDTHEIYRADHELEHQRAIENAIPDFEGPAQEEPSVEVSKKVSL